MKVEILSQVKSLSPRVQRAICNGKNAINMKYAILLISPFVAGVLQFYSLHLIAVVASRMVFDGSWWETLLSVFFMTGTGIGVLRFGHKLYHEILMAGSLKFLQALLISAATLVAASASAGYWGNFINAFSWDDKEFLPFALYQAHPLKGILASTLFFLASAGSLYFGFLAAWVGLFTKRKEQ